MSVSSTYRREPRLGENPLHHEFLDVLHTLQQQDYQFVAVSAATHARFLHQQRGREAQSLTEVFGWNLPCRRDQFEQLLPHWFERLCEQQLLRPYEDAWVAQFRVASVAGLLLLHSAYACTDSDAVLLDADTYRLCEVLRQQVLPWLRQLDAPRCLELCCGTSAAALLLAEHAHARVSASDINLRALQYSRINADLNARPQLQVFYGDVLEGIDEAFDLIVANPPCLLDFAQRPYHNGGEPLGAGLALNIVQTSLGHLRVGGRLLLMTGVAIIAGVDALHAALQTVLARHPRFVWQYALLDPDVYPEQLRSFGYEQVESIRLVLLTIERQA